MLIATPTTCSLRCKRPPARTASHRGRARGTRHNNGSSRGKAGADAGLKAALAILNEVGATLDKLREEIPESDALDQKIVEVNQMRVDCRKRAALGS